MTRVDLLDALRDFTAGAVKDLIMPVSIQKGDERQEFRTAEVYRMRLPESSAAKKKAPYIIHQIITGEDEQKPGQSATSTAVVRSIFCVYNSDEQEGSLMLLNLMERVRIALLKQVIVGDQFALDLEAKVEAVIYPNDTAPYYSGEMASVWTMPPVEREVNF